MRATSSGCPPLLRGSLVLNNTPVLSRPSRSWITSLAMAFVPGVIIPPGTMAFIVKPYTHATIMLKQGVHPKIVQERLGHSTISTTLDTYSHIAPGLQQAAAMAFDDILRKDSSLDKQLAEILQN
jgi:hypothetical protein